MKTVRRLTVEVERRLLLIQRGGTAGADALFDNTTMEEPKGDCPDCGSPWVLLHDAGTAARKGLLAERTSRRGSDTRKYPSA